MKDGIQIRRDNNKTKNNAVKPKKRTGVVAGIIAGAIIVVLAAGTAAAGYFVDKLDTIYPNVQINGIDLSGMTVDEAKKALTVAGYEQAVANVAAIINFPDGEKLTITGQEAGLILYTDDAAKAAYNYGKDGSFLANELNYVKSLFSTLDLEHIGAVKINEDYIRTTVSDYAKKFNDKIMNAAYKVTADSITITKGFGGALADVNELHDLVETALSRSVAESSPVSMDYSVGTNGGTDIDLQSIYDTIYTEPVSAIYDTTTNQVTQSVVGVSFDVDKAQKALDAAQTGSTVIIQLDLEDPAVTTEQLQGIIFRDILSEKATYVAGTANRVRNVKLAAAAMNGKILNPGDTFSYNETLGERTIEKGYAEAGAYVGGAVVQEVGGGICQASSTLYYCVLYADLEVVDRSNHMFIVTYLPLGNDAAVNWGTIDFKFKNNTEYPIKIESYIKDGHLNVKLHGTKVDENYVKVKYTVISTTEFKTIKKEDPSVAPGTTKEDSSGHPGYVVDTYKYIYDANGNELSKTFLARSKYRVQDKVIRVPVGTLTPSPSASEEPSPSTAEPSPSALEPSPSTLEPSPSTLEPSPSTAEPSASTAEPSPSAPEPSPSEPAPSQP